MEKRVIPFDDTHYVAYYAAPESRTGKGVLLLHPWWGLNMVMGQFCDLLAGAGFVVMAPDYYQGRVADTIEGATLLRNQMNRKMTQKITTHAFNTLQSDPLVEKKGLVTIGFSLGAGFAIDLARKKPRIVSGVVLFYGLGGGKFDKINAVFQGHFAENDPYEDVESVRWFANKLHEAGREFDYFTYPGTQHWFMEPNRPEYRAKEARLAWERTIQFIREH